jgi:hypothetical protein
MESGMRVSTPLCLLLLASTLLPAQQYFPPDVLGKTPAEHEAAAKWYAKHLKALREPSLWELSQRDPKAEVYRFLWLRSHHHPVSVRLVVRSGGSGWMNARMTTGKGANEPGGIGRYSIFWLTKAKTQSFLSAMDTAHFWSLPGLPESTQNAVSPDGARWILEGVKNGQYHVIDRWSPDSSDPVRQIGMLALKLGRFKIRRPGEIY